MLSRGTGIPRQGRSPFDRRCQCTQHIRASWFRAIHRSGLYGALTVENVVTRDPVDILARSMTKLIMPHPSRKAHTIRACASTALDPTAGKKERESDSSSTRIGTEAVSTSHTFFQGIDASTWWLMPEVFCNTECNLSARAACYSFAPSGD